MGLCSSDVDRLGMLSHKLVRASRLVVDSGTHDLGWTREQRVKYVRDNAVLAPGEIESEVDRYVIWTAQASTYMPGMLEIRSIRADAERTLGGRFNLRAIHDRVREDGPMPLAALRKRIARWAAQAKR